MSVPCFRRDRRWGVAKLVRQHTVNVPIAGSIPAAPAILKRIMKTIKSIELPTDCNYKLTKKGKLNSSMSMMDKGVVTIGPLQTSPIQVGHGVVFGRGTDNAWFTTIVTKIIVKKNKVVFHTLNSIYELEEVNDSENP